MAQTTFQEMLNEEQKRLKGMQKQTHLSDTSLPQVSQQKKQQLEQFLINNSPAIQSQMAASPKNCMFGDSPELYKLKKQYGDNAPVAWLIPQLKDLSEYCGVKDKLMNEHLLQCARVLASEYGYLKTSEFMLFFHLFKTGRYGEFYGNVDPLKISAALRKFLIDRNDYFFRIEQKEREKKRDEARKGAVTYEEYKRMVAENKI